jgi:dTMP kinase
VSAGPAVPSRRPGALIAFEGLDQSGKETQARHLRARLERDGHTVHAVSFPDYDTPIGREISSALAGEREFRPDVLQLLYVANRMEYLPRLEQWLGAGHVVICDRYRASSLAYGEAQGVDAAWLTDVQRLLPAPTVTVLLDIVPRTAVARKTSGRDRFERDLALLGRVRESYRRQATADDWVVIDAERSKDEVAAAVERAVLTRIARPSAR